METTGIVNDIVDGIVMCSLTSVVMKRILCPNFMVSTKIKMVFFCFTTSPHLLSLNNKLISALEVHGTCYYVLPSQGVSFYHSQYQTKRD